MAAVTEYAVRYTKQAGSPPTVDTNIDRTDLAKAEKLLVDVRAW